MLSLTRGPRVRIRLPPAAIFCELTFGCASRDGGRRLRLLTFHMADVLGRAGQISDGLAAIAEAIVRAERSEERWAATELLRPRRTFARALLWSGGRARRAVGEERMS